MQNVAKSEKKEIIKSLKKIWRITENMVSLKQVLILLYPKTLEMM